MTYEMDFVKKNLQKVCKYHSFSLLSKMIEEKTNYYASASTIRRYNLENHTVPVAYLLSLCNTFNFSIEDFCSRDIDFEMKQTLKATDNTKKVLDNRQNSQITDNFNGKNTNYTGKPYSMYMENHEKLFADFNLYYMVTTELTDQRLQPGRLRLRYDKYNHRYSASADILVKGNPEKHYQGEFYITRGMDIAVIELFSEKVGEKIVIQFNHTQRNVATFELAIGLSVSMSAGENRTPVANKVIISRQHINLLSFSNRKIITNQLSINKEINDQHLYIGEKSIYKYFNDLPEAKKLIQYVEHNLTINSKRLDKDHFTSLNTSETLDISPSRLEEIYEFLTYETSIQAFSKTNAKDSKSILKSLEFLEPLTLSVDKKENNFTVTIKDSYEQNLALPLHCSNKEDALSNCELIRQALVNPVITDKTGLYNSYTRDNAFYYENVKTPSCNFELCNNEDSYLFKLILSNQLLIESITFKNFSKCLNTLMSLIVEGQIISIS